MATHCVMCQFDSGNEKVPTPLFDEPQMQRHAGIANVGNGGSRIHELCHFWRLRVLSFA